MKMATLWQSALTKITVDAHQLYAMGWGADGQLGLGQGRTSDANVPALLPWTAPIKKLAGSTDFTLALTGELLPSSLHIYTHIHTHNGGRVRWDKSGNTCGRKEETDGKRLPSLLLPSPLAFLFISRTLLPFSSSPILHKRHPPKWAKLNCWRLH